MKKNFLLILGLVFVVAGVVFAYLANFQSADICAFAVVMFGAGLAACQLWNKRDTAKKTWLSVLSLVLMGVGAFLLGFGGFSQDTMVTIITSVFGFVAIIASLIIAAMQSKVQKQMA